MASMNHNTWHQCFELNTSMYDQHQCLKSIAGLYNPTPLFQAKSQHVQPNPSKLEMARIWWEPDGMDIVEVPNHSQATSPLSLIMYIASFLYYNSSIKLTLLHILLQLLSFFEIFKMNHHVIGAKSCC